MKIEIFGKDYNVSDSLKAITEKKCAKLDRYFGDDENAAVGHDGRLSQSDVQSGGELRLSV